MKDWDYYNASDYHKWHGLPIAPEEREVAREIFGQRKREFWQDCRQEIGYDDYLTEQGCVELEAEAWYRGHSCGYREVYGELQDLWNFVDKILKEKK